VNRKLVHIPSKLAYERWCVILLKTLTMELAIDLHCSAQPLLGKTSWLMLFNFNENIKWSKDQGPCAHRQLHEIYRL
jgi:hypothetical protein